MRFSFFLSLFFISLFIFSQEGNSRNFEGRLTYISYQIISGDSIESSTMNYWLKDHLYKHSGYVPKIPFIDLGTLYADADQMTKTNVKSSGQMVRIPMNPKWKAPKLIAQPSNELDTVLGFKCGIWTLKNPETEAVRAKLWITQDIESSNFDAFVELFEYKNTLFPCTGIDGWIVKRENFVEEGETFVTELVEVEAMELNAAEMVAY